MTHRFRAYPQTGLLLSHTVLVQATTYLLRPTGTYRAIELDVPPAWLGALAASFAFVPLLLAVPSGQAVDRLGERRVMVVGALLLSAGAATFLTAGHTVLGLVAGSVVLGTGHLCSVVGQQSVVANSTPPGRYDTAFGHYTFAASLGQALGPALIIAFAEDGAIPATQAIFVAAACLSALVLATTIAWRIPVLQRPVGAQASAGGLRSVVTRPGLLRALTVSCIVLAAVDILMVYLPALGAERGIPAGVIGLLLTIRAAASMTSRLFLGRLSARLGRRPLLVGSTLVAAGGLAVSAVPQPLWLLAAVIAVVGLGLGAGQPLTMSWLAETTPPGLRGRAMALRLTGNRVGQVVVPSLAGLLAAGAGATGVLVITAAALAAAGHAARRLSQEPTADA